MTLNELVPTYGNWGGPGWSGGKRTIEGEAPNPEGETYDALDVLFKAHDLAYWAAENESNSVKAAKMIFDADVALLRDMQTLNDDNIGFYGELYQPLATIAFGDKSLWDLAQIALAQLEQLGANNGQYDPFPDNHTTIPSDINGLFNSAQGWMPPRRGDPLVLDIDGDGIETIQIDTNSPILFDHDGDGIKIATGWVKSDDALLVFDRNANGTIDNGSELFGDQTIVNGVKATDGFAALSAEDSNANGIFDANDTNFNNVRLWQDLNQNGISETNELKTLTQAGIVSISLSSTQTNTVVNGGIQTAEGTFTKADGTSGESATVDVGSLGNYIFDSNSFYREFTDTIPLTEAASALPEMQGSGVVRDLREAASMQTTEGAALTNILTQYSSLTTHDEQIAFMDELLLAWGATSGFKDIATEATQHGYTLTTNLNAEQFSILNVLEQFNGKHFYRMPWESTENTTARLGMSVDETTKTISINMFEGQLSILEQAYQELVESVYDGLVMQTRLAPYLDSITINIDENGLAFDVAPMITQLEALQLTNPRDALIDQLELIQYAGKNFSIMGWNWSETLQTMITQIGTQVDVKAVFSELGYINNIDSNIVYDLDGTNRIDYGGSENAILVGFDGDDIIYSGYGDDLINGGNGNDKIYDYQGNDTYIFNLGDGADTIYDSSWNTNNKDIIRFGEGITSDNLDVTRINNNLVLAILGTTDKITVSEYFMDTSSKIEEFVFADGTTLTSQQIESMAVFIGTDGDDNLYGYELSDRFIGGKGNDILDGQDGNDTYIFNLGDGADTIYDSSWNTNNKDIIRFGEGITSDNLDVTRINDNLLLAILGTTDKITVNDYFMGAYSKIEEFAFADGTTLTSQQIESMVVLRGTDGNDTLYGYETSDVLVGTKGNDMLDGQDGDDTYIFNLGDGADTIYDSSWNTNNKDIIRFGEGITSDNLDVTRINNNLVLAILGTTDKITVSEYFMDTSSKIEEFVFADGTTLTSQQIESMVVLRGTDGNDIINGSMESDTINGKKGDDQLYGDDGDDTYIFNLGDGQDTIYDSSWGSNGKDTIAFGHGITQENLSVTRKDYNLVISIQNTQDSITITDWYMGEQNKIELITFSDGGALSTVELQDMAVFIGTDGDDNLYGYELSDRFIGGKGNDILDGQDGNDTYIFNLGDGADTIYDSSWNTNNKDIIRFGEGITSDNLDVTRINNNLVLAILGTTDKITVNDYFMGAYSKIEEFAFADGTTLTSQQIESMVVLRGTDGNDTLYGYETNDVLVGTKGNDMLDGQDGDDTYIFNLGDGADTIYDYSGNDKIVLGEGITSDNLDVTRINDNLLLAILGTTDKITVNDYFMGAYSKIEEFAFADGTTLTSQQIESMVVLRGTDGNDTLYGYETSDVLVGTKGNDMLDGQDGDDTYIFNLGDGADTIYDSSWNTNNKDIIRFGEGISSDSLDVTRINDNLLLAILGTTDKITVNDYFMGAYSKIEEFVFADGTTLTYQQIESMVVLRGTDGNDIINGSMESDTINGRKGDDKLYGNDGNDTYIFNLGDGQDTIYDSSWNTNNKDIIRFGEGISSDSLDVTRINDNLLLAILGTTDKITVNDYFMGAYSKIEEFVFVDGTTLTYQQIESMVVLRGTDGNDIINGSMQSDTINGRKGDDKLYGNDGDDTYIFNLGDGADTIYDSSWNTNNKDTIRFGEGISSDNLDVTRINNNLVLAILGTTDKITVSEYFMDTSSKIEEFTFSDGTTLTSQQIESMAVFIGTDGNDIINGSMESDTINGKKGDDQLYGDDGDDTYIFNLGDGADTIYDSSWNTNNKDTIRFGEGITSDNLDVTRINNNLVLAILGTTDKITVSEYFMDTSSKIEEFVFNDGTTLTSQQIESMAVFIGTDGNDIINGSMESDTINGKKGDDQLYGDDGDDTYIFNLGDGADTIYDYSGNDKIVLGEGITNDNLDVTRINNNLVLAILGTTDKITVSEYFMDTSSKIEEFAFADGTTLTSQQIESMAVFIGTDGDDNLYGYELSDRFIGGKGNDILDGQDGNDTYIFNLGDGADTIYDSSWNTNNKDTIRFGEGISSDSLDVTRINDNLLLVILGTTDKITVNDYFMGAYSKIEEFVFADGTTLTSQQIESMVVLRGTDGNDIINGSMESDTINGKKGDDQLYGDDGDDTYIFNLGDGADTIYDSSWNTNNKDIIRFGEGITSDNLDVTRINNNLVLAILGTTDKITVSEYFMDTSSKIEEFVFNDGTTLTSQQIESMVVLRGTDGNDIINGSMESDTINGKKGDDQLYGDDGDDTYIFNLGDGQDTIYDYGTSTTNGDILKFGEGIVAADVTITQDQSNLYFTLNSGEDKIMIANYFDAPEYQIEQVTFTDGTFWDSTMFNQIL